MKDKVFLKQFNEMTNLELASQASVVQLQNLVNEHKKIREDLISQKENATPQELANINQKLAHCNNQMRKANQIINMINFDQRQRKVKSVKQNITADQAIAFYMTAQENLETAVFENLRMLARIK